MVQAVFWAAAALVALLSCVGAVTVVRWIRRQAVQFVFRMRLRKLGQHGMLPFGAQGDDAPRPEPRPRVKRARRAGSAPVRREPGPRDWTQWE